MSNAQAPIVVGVDGSEGAESALTWALDEARSRRVEVRLVYAYGGALTAAAISIYGRLPVPEVPHVRSVAEELLAGVSADATRLAPDVSVSTHAVSDDAARALIEESANASTIVLGSRHRGTAGSVLLGSVSAAVAARAACPAVVMRGPSTPDQGNVVVGVDGHPSSAGVLAFAFAYASRHSLGLHAVLCWHPDPLAEMMWRAKPPAPQDAEALLSELLAGWRENYPDVAVQHGVVREHPVAGLVGAATAQNLLVVGTRGRHALPGTLLGSVSQGVLHHATCPVAVVAPDTD
jgi:nucleotide-binding universal stress UspA family protein